MNKDAGVIDFYHTCVFISANKFPMVDKVILDIHHSDDYTDYLLMTAGLTNARIIPIVGAGTQAIKAKADNHTLILKCYNTRREPSPWDTPVESDTNCGSVRILSRFYLDDDGTINSANAEIVRQTVQEVVLNALLSPANMLQVYRHYFPLLWSKREVIYADPKLFFADSGRYGPGIADNNMPIGAILKAIEEDPGNFRIRLGGGCSCGQRPFLIDWDRIHGGHWTIYTWCPVCHSRREIRTWNFQRAWNCEQSIDRSRQYYDRGQGLSALNLFDVIDAVKDSSLRSE